MQNLWKQVADQYCTSAEEVQAEIAEAIRQGMNNPDADVQQAWAEIPVSRTSRSRRTLSHGLPHSCWRRNPAGIRSCIGTTGNGSQTVIPKSVHLLRKMCHIPETTQGTVKTVLLHFLGNSFAGNVFFCIHKIPCKLPESPCISGKLCYTNIMQPQRKYASGC